MRKISLYIFGAAALLACSYLIYEGFIKENPSDPSKSKNLPVLAIHADDKKDSKSGSNTSGENNAAKSQSDADATDSQNTTVDSMELKSESSGSAPFLIALVSTLIISIIIILILSIAVSKLYTWRKRIEENSKLLVMPEVYYEKLNELAVAIQSIGGIIGNFGTHLTMSEKNTEKKFEEFLQLIGNAQSSLDAKDEELKRFKQGYDFKIKKDSINTILKLRERIEFYTQDQSSAEDLIKACEGMLKMIDHELDAMGVISISIDAGTSIREIDSFEVTETVVTHDQKKVGQVIETIKNGYLIQGQAEEVTIIKKPFLKIYIEE